MANKNITQLTQQTGSADPTSLFYTVTGGTNDHSLPLSVLFNSPTITGTPSIAGYLTSALAASTYLTQSLAASTYAPKASPTFSGTVVIPTVTLSGGTINSTSVGATTASTGAFTTLSASSTVSGAGFTSLFASPSAIGSTAPNTGSFTTIVSSGAANFNSLTAGATSVTNTLTPSQTFGIVGTTTNNNANAGSVGEYISSTVLVGSAISLTNGTPANVTSISLTAGDWDVSGAINFSNGTGVAVTYIGGCANTVSATLNSGNFFLVSAPGITGATVSGSAIPTIRVSIASTTTVFLVAQCGFASGTLSAFGNISARRRR